MTIMTYNMMQVRKTDVISVTNDVKNKYFDVLYEVEQNH